jgi:hypothetical protein
MRLHWLLCAVVGLVALGLPGSASADGGCPNEAIRQEQGSTYLPMCMAYELISPAVTARGRSAVDPVLAPDGERAWFGKLFGPIVPGDPNAGIPLVQATRTSGGWQLRDLDLPGNGAYSFVGASADGSRTIVMGCSLQLAFSCHADFLDFEAVSQDGTRETLLTAPYNFSFAEVVAATADAKVIFVQDPLREGFTPILPVDTQTEGQGLYVSREGRVEFLGYDEHGNVLACGEELVQSGLGQRGVSPDGSTVVFQSPSHEAHENDPACPPIDVYVRRYGHSLDISAPRNGNPDLGASHKGSSPDGNTVYFTTPSQLVVDDTDEATDLYAYDLPSGALTRLTPGSEVESVAVSPHGDYLYFTTTKAIAGEGADDAQNLFVYHAGAIHHIATTSEGYFSIGANSDSSVPSPITPDGTHLVFVSQASLTGQSTEGNFEIYRYSAQDESLGCVSCPPDGSPATAGARLGALGAAATYDARLQSDDGSAILFSTAAALVAGDTNGVRDAYLWHDGVVSLISDGHGPSLQEGPAKAAYISADGRTVVFTSAERLVPGLEQGNVKVYAARVDGGFSTPVPRSPCSGDACRGGVGGAPGFASPGSAGLTGVGNVLAPPGVRRALPEHRRPKGCGKGTVRRQVKTKHGRRVTRCVRKASRSSSTHGVGR